MKKITSKEPITLRIDGTTVLEINANGCLTEDRHAEVAKARLGGHVTITDVSPEEAKEQAEDILKAEEAKLKEEEEAKKKADEEEAAKKAEAEKRIEEERATRDAEAALENGGASAANTTDENTGNSEVTGDNQ